MMLKANTILIPREKKPGATENKEKDKKRLFPSSFVSGKSSEDEKIVTIYWKQQRLHCFHSLQTAMSARYSEQISYSVHIVHILNKQKMRIKKIDGKEIKTEKNFYSKNIVDLVRNANWTFKTDNLKILAYSRDLKRPVIIISVCEDNIIGNKEKTLISIVFNN